MPKFRKKPVVIEAMQFDGHNYDEVAAWAGDKFKDIFSPAGTLDLYIKTLEGEMHVSVNDWIIKGVKGEFYPCKPDIFEQTYERADNAD